MSDHSDRVMKDYLDYLKLDFWSNFELSHNFFPVFLSYDNLAKLHLMKTEATTLFLNVVFIVITIIINTNSSLFCFHIPAYIFFSDNSLSLHCLIKNEPIQEP